MPRFRATYQRRIDERDGTIVHTLVYPDAHDLFPASKLPFLFALQTTADVGTVEEAPDGTVTATAADGTIVGSGPGSADAAISALIEYDQQQHNHT